MLAALEPGEGRDRLAVTRVQLEVQVRMQAVRIAGVADVADQLARGDAISIAEPGGVGDARHARAAVVVAGGQVVVQVDVLVGRAAAPVQVEHAARTRRARPEDDASRLDRDDRRVTLSEDVVGGVDAAGAWLAEVVAVGDGADHREDDLRGRGALGGGGRREDCRGEDDEEDPSGCRPRREHGEGRRAKSPRLTDVPAQTGTCGRRTESSRPGKRSSSSARRSRFRRRWPAGRVSITPASRRTLKWCVSVEFETPTRNVPHARGSGSEAASSRTIASRTGSPSAWSTSVSSLSITVEINVAVSSFISIDVEILLPRRDVWGAAGRQS